MQHGDSKENSRHRAQQSMLMVFDTSSVRPLIWECQCCKTLSNNSVSRRPKVALLPQRCWKIRTSTNRSAKNENAQIGNVINGFNFDQTEYCDSDYELDRFNSQLNKVSMIPHSDSVKEAWLKTEVAIKSYHVVERNSNKFNDEKVMQKMSKYE